MYLYLTTQTATSYKQVKKLVFKLAFFQATTSWIRVAVIVLYINGLAELDWENERENWNKQDIKCISHGIWLATVTWWALSTTDTLLQHSSSDGRGLLRVDCSSFCIVAKNMDKALQTMPLNQATPRWRVPSAAVSLLVKANGGQISSCEKFVH